MLTIERTIICIANTSLLQKNGRRRSNKAALAKKRDFSENSTKDQTIFPLKLSVQKLLSQSATAVFALGFIDAGYSGDWSRIGVISKENEDVLKSAAFVVVPFCIFLILSFSTKSED